MVVADGKTFQTSEQGTDPRSLSGPEAVHQNILRSQGERQKRISENHYHENCRGQRKEYTNIKRIYPIRPIQSYADIFNAFIEFIDKIHK